jgi:molybdopterin/thiamine biosynthesis adenylyltransferase
VRAPVVKAEHRPDRLADGRIRIGGQVYGIAAEIEDPAGSIWTLLQAMDGTRSTEQVVDVVTAEHPQLTPADVRRGIQQLTGAGYLEDAKPAPPEGLTERELERYDRTRIYFRSIDLTPREDPWHFQRALKNARVPVLGLGGVGSVVALALAQLGVGQVHLVDFDDVELSNLNRQILFTEDDIGRPKLDTALRRLRKVNSDIDVTGTAMRIESADDIAPLIEGATVVAMCADQPMQIRDWMNSAALRSGIPWTEGGYHGPQVRMGLYTPGFGGCFVCNRHSEHARLAQFTGSDGPAAGHYGVRRSTAPVFPPSAQLAGNLIVNALVAAITGVPRLPRSYGIEFNLANMENPYALTTYPRWPSCEACR